MAIEAAGSIVRPVVVCVWQFPRGAGECGDAFVHFACIWLGAWECEVGGGSGAKYKRGRVVRTGLSQTGLQSCCCVICRLSRHLQEFVVRFRGHVCCHGLVSVFRRIADVHQLWLIKFVEHPGSQGLMEGKAVVDSLE